MYVMQYEITLPAGDHMTTIRHRVATRGSALDDFSGLGIKTMASANEGAKAPLSTSTRRSTSGPRLRA